MVHLIPKEVTLNYTATAELTNVFLNLVKMTTGHEVLNCLGAG